MSARDVILQWLRDHEEKLSDGYEFYLQRGCDFDEVVDDEDVLGRLADDLVQRLAAVKP